MNDREKSRSSAGGHKYIYAGEFDYTLPRPPALGEERVYGTTERAVFQAHSENPQKAASPVPSKFMMYILFIVLLNLLKELFMFLMLFLIFRN